MSKIPSLPDKIRAWVDAQGRAFDDFYLWCKTVDTRLRAGAEGLVEGLSGKAKLSQTWEVTIHVAKVTTDPIYVVLKAVKARTVTAIVTDCDSGTCTLTGKIDGTNLGGTANSVSTTEQERTHSSANSIAAGQDLTLVPSSVSSCRNMRVRVSGTFNLDA